MENQEEKEFLFYKKFLLHGISTNLNTRILSALLEKDVAEQKNNSSNKLEEDVKPTGTTVGGDGAPTSVEVDNIKPTEQLIQSVRIDGKLSVGGDTLPNTLRNSSGSSINIDVIDGGEHGEEDLIEQVIKSEQVSDNLPDEGAQLLSTLGEGGIQTLQSEEIFDNSLIDDVSAQISPLSSSEESGLLFKLNKKKQQSVPNSRVIQQEQSQESLLLKLRTSVKCAKSKRDLEISLAEFKSTVQNVERLKKLSTWEILSSARSITMLSMIEKKAEESLEQWRSQRLINIQFGENERDLNSLKQFGYEGFDSLEGMSFSGDVGVREHPGGSTMRDKAEGAGVGNDFSSVNGKEEVSLATTGITSGVKVVSGSIKRVEGLLSKTGGLIRGKLSKSAVFNIKKQLYFNKYKVFNFIERTRASSKMLAWYLTSPSEIGVFDEPAVLLYLKEICEKYNLGSISESSTTSNAVSMERLLLLDLHLSKLCKRFGVAERDIGQDGALNINLIEQKSWHYFLNTSAMFHLNEFLDSELSTEFKETVSKKGIKEHCCLSFDPSSKNAMFDLEHEWWHFVDSRLLKKVKSKLPQIDWKVRQEFECFFKENFSSSDIESMIVHLSKSAPSIYESLDYWCKENKLWDMQDVVACVFDIDSPLNLLKPKSAEELFYSHQTEKVKSLLPQARRVFNKLWSNIQGVSELSLREEKQSHSDLYENLYKNLGQMLGAQQVGEYGLSTWSKAVNSVLNCSLKKVSYALGTKGFEKELKVLLDSKALDKHNMFEHCGNQVSKEVGHGGSAGVMNQSGHRGQELKVENVSPEGAAGAVIEEYNKNVNLKSFEFKALAKSFVEKLQTLEVHASRDLSAINDVQERSIGQICKVLPAEKGSRSIEKDGAGEFLAIEDRKALLHTKVNVFIENNIKDLLKLSLYEHTYGLVLSDRSVYAKKSVAMIVEEGLYWCTPTEMCARAISRALPWESFYKEDPYPEFSYKGSRRTEQYVGELARELSRDVASPNLIKKESLNVLGERLNIRRAKNVGSEETVHEQGAPGIDFSKSKSEEQHLRVVAGFEKNEKNRRLSSF